MPEWKLESLTPSSSLCEVYKMQLDRGKKRKHFHGT